MRLKIQTKDQYRASFDNWERWFAWHPVWTNGFIHWLEFVERRRASNWWEVYWQHRPLSKQSGEEENK